MFPEVPGGGGQPVHVVGDIEQGQRFGSDATFAEAEVFGTFRRVFGDVASGVFGGQLAGWAAVDGLGVELLTEAQHHAGSVGYLDGESHVRSGLADRVGKPGGVDADLGWLVVLARAVESDEGMEVDHASALEFRHLDKRDPAPPTELGRGHPGLVGKGAADGDGESTPQFWGVPVESDVGGVVVAVRADWLPQLWIIPAMNRGAPGWPPVRA